MTHKQRTREGFTLIELMIAITIISILVALGLSAYGKARDRQIGVVAGEQIIALLQKNLGEASVGKKDCSGKYLGQEVVITTPNTLTTRSICEGDDGAATATSIPGIEFNAGTTIIFNALNKGIELEGGVAELLLSYDSSANLSYNIKLMNSGTIEYLGIAE
jgi:prepilin-type N-terminal cleavage/methylation domain-containing protein